MVTKENVQCMALNVSSHCIRTGVCHLRRDTNFHYQVVNTIYPNIMLLCEIVSAWNIYRNTED